MGGGGAEGDKGQLPPATQRLEHVKDTANKWEDCGPIIIVASFAT